MVVLVHGSFRTARPKSCASAKDGRAPFLGKNQFACKSKSVTAGLWAGGAGVPRVSRGRLGVASSPRVR